MNRRLEVGGVIDAAFFNRWNFMGFLIVKRQTTDSLWKSVVLSKCELVSVADKKERVVI